MSNIFQYGIASGDPLQDRVILWTHISTGQETEVAWEVAMDMDFKNIIQSGMEIAHTDHNFSIHADPTELQAGTHYYYRFHALGETSVVGRTKTLPANDVSHIRFAQVSCAKFNAGFFNAYARIAERDDLDFLLHLGDYIYEASNTPPAGQTPGADIGRPFSPLHECKTLEDYRMRYAQYHSDPDIKAMHASLPVIATVDDHEFADGAWRGGADVHDELHDGPWSERIKNALRARWEWLPIRHPDPKDTIRVYRSVHFGKLADLFLINTRIYRDQPVPPPEMNDPNRTALGSEQREWLFNAFDKSTAKWRLLGNPSVLGTTYKPNIPESIKTVFLKTKLIAADGQGPDYDQWDGYPAERNLLFEKMRGHALGNFVVLSGDIHICLAQELREHPYDMTEEPVAIECINTSLTSQNFDDKMKWEPRTKSIEYEKEMMEFLPEIKYVDLDSHGYNVVDVTPERVQVEWWNVDTVLKRTKEQSLGAAWKIESEKVQLVKVK